MLKDEMSTDLSGQPQYRPPPPYSQPRVARSKKHTGPVFDSVDAGMAATIKGEGFAALVENGNLGLYVNEVDAAVLHYELTTAKRYSNPVIPEHTLGSFVGLTTRLTYDEPVGEQIHVFPGEIVEVQGIGCYRILERGSRRNDLGHTDSVVAAEVIPNRGVFDIRAFGAVGDYDASIEIPGKIPANATDNFPAILSAALAFERHIGAGVLGFVDGGDYWASNMPRFRVSNFSMWVSKGTTIRTTTPTSFGTTIYLGEVRKTKNTIVFGGGNIRNYLPVLDRLPLWRPDTEYPKETYVRTSNNHVYWSLMGGKSSRKEPDVIANSELDGSIIWRDALNENGISVHGDDSRVIGMKVPEASNKGICCQGPPWSNIWFEGNTVGKTHHDGIELKGNQGLAGQQTFFGRRGAVIGNVVIDAGRQAIHVQQPSAGYSPNQNISVRNNIALRNGYRYRGGCHAGIRVNRCESLVVSENLVMDSSGNGYHLRLCSQVEGDIDVEKCGCFAIHLQHCKNFKFERVTASGGSPEFSAIRETGAEGECFMGEVRVKGGNYEFAYESIKRKGRVFAYSLELDDGISGQYKGILPSIRTKSLPE